DENVTVRHFGLDRFAMQITDGFVLLRQIELFQDVLHGKAAQRGDHLWLDNRHHAIHERAVKGDFSGCRLTLFAGMIEYDISHIDIFAEELDPSQHLCQDLSRRADEWPALFGLMFTR